MIRRVAAFLAVFLLSSAAPAAWGGCVAIFTDEYVRILNTSGRSYSARNPLPANITTVSQCDSWLRSQSIWSSDFRFRQTRCECSGSSSGGSGFSLPPGATVRQQVAAGIIGAMFQSLFAPPPSGPSAAEVARKNAEAAEARRKAEEEAQRRAKEEADRKARAKEERLAWAEQMVGPEGTPLSAGAQDTSGWKGLDVDPSPPSESSRLAMLSPRPASGMNSMERLRCAAALSAASLQYSGTGGPEAAGKARFYAQQAEKVSAGQPIEVDCPASSVGPAIPEPPPPTVVDLPAPTLAEIRKTVEADRVALDNVGARLQALAERKKEIEERKAAAEKKVGAPKSEGAEPAIPQAAEAPDTLAVEAAALLRESEAELAEVARDEKALQEERTRLAATLDGHEAQARQLSDKAGGTSRQDAPASPP